MSSFLSQFDSWELKRAFGLGKLIEALQLKLKSWFEKRLFYLFVFNWLCFFALWWHFVLVVPVKFVIGEVVDGTNAVWNLRLQDFANCVVYHYQSDKMMDLKRTLFSICTLINDITIIAVVFKNIIVCQVSYLGISKSPPALHLCRWTLLFKMFIPIS